MEEWERLVNELRAEVTQREQELEFLHAIDLRLLEPEQDPQELFSFILKRMHEIVRPNYIAILLRRSTFLESAYANRRSAIGQRVPIPKSLTGLCLESDEMVSIPDLITGQHKARYAPIQGYHGPQMRSLLAIPIRIRGIPVGVLNLESKNQYFFKPVHERLSFAVATEIAIALERTQTLASTGLLADVDHLMFASDNSQRVIETALERVLAELQRLEHVRHSGAQIMFLRGEDELEIVHSTDPSAIGLTQHIAKSVSGRAVRERRTVIVGDVSQDMDYQQTLGNTVRSEIAVPILWGENDSVVIGVLNVASEEEDAFYGFYQVVLESFSEKVKTLLAFAKLRADVTEALELRSANDLLAAVGDQTSHLIHRLNNTVDRKSVV